MLRKRLARLGQTAPLKESLSLLILYWIYSSIRWFVARDTPYEAFENAFKLIHWERQLGIFYEATFQSWLIDHGVGFIHIANLFYTVGYFPVLLLFGGLLYRFSPDRFQVFKQTFLLALGLALFCFTVFPLAPPRMMPWAGFVDTQEMFSDGFYNRKLVLSFYNPYAAMPSLHFGWALLVGLITYGFERRLLKLIGLLYPSFMALVIVVTGHHYFLDIVGGGIVVGGAYGLVWAMPVIAREIAASPVALDRAVPAIKSPSFWSSLHATDSLASQHFARRSNPVHQQNARSTFIGLLTNRIPPL